MPCRNSRRVRCWIAHPLMKRAVVHRSTVRELVLGDVGSDDGADNQKVWKTVLRDVRLHLVRRYCTLHEPMTVVRIMETWDEVRRRRRQWLGFGLSRGLYILRYPKKKDERVSLRIISIQIRSLYCRYYFELSFSLCLTNCGMRRMVTSIRLFILLARQLSIPMPPRLNHDFRPSTMKSCVAAKSAVFGWLARFFSAPQTTLNLEHTATYPLQALYSVSTLRIASKT